MRMIRRVATRRQIPQSPMQPEAETRIWPFQPRSWIAFLSRSFKAGPPFAPHPGFSGLFSRTLVQIKTGQGLFFHGTPSIFKSRIFRGNPLPNPPSPFWAVTR
jgi:hypothetical protein